MDYPFLDSLINKVDFIEHFTLSKEERYLLSQWRKDKNILGFAVLLKSYVFLARVS